MGKFKVGDRVRVKNVKVGTLSCGWPFDVSMVKYIGKEFTIAEDWGNGVYRFISSPFFWAEDWLEPVENKEDIIQKLKVGDKVRVRDIKVGTISHGWIFGSFMSEYVGKTFTIAKVGNDDDYRLKGLSYAWAEDWLEPAKPETIVIYRNGDKTVALDKRTGKKAEAKCSKDDEYDFYVGAKIAFERLIGAGRAKEEPKPKLYNGKVVCVTSRFKRLRKAKYTSLAMGILDMILVVVCRHFMVRWTRLKIWKKCCPAHLLNL